MKFIVKTTNSSNNIQKEVTQEYYIELIDLVVYIEGGNRMHGYSTELDLIGVAKDLNFA